MNRQASTIARPFMGSSEDYLARAAKLLDAAGEFGSPDAAALRSQADEWLRLAILADWQQAMIEALGAIGVTPATTWPEPGQPPPAE